MDIQYGGKQSREIIYHRDPVMIIWPTLLPFQSLEDFADDDEDDDMDQEEEEDLEDEDDEDYKEDRRGSDKKEPCKILYIYLPCPHNVLMRIHINNILLVFAAVDKSAQKADELDKRLIGLEHGVDLALQRTKIWSKYAKDISTYLERRAHLGKIDTGDSTRMLALSVNFVLLKTRFLYGKLTVVHLNYNFFPQSKSLQTNFQSWPNQRGQPS